MKRILFSILCISLISAGFAEADISGKNAKLIQAARDSNLHVVQTALADGAEVNTTDTTYGVTALWITASKGDTEIVKLLLEKGADVNAKDSLGETTLIGAAKNGCTEVVKLLLEKDADVNAKTNDGATALMLASKTGRMEVIKLLLEKGAKVNARANKGVTALWLAAQNGQTETVKLLLEKGAEVDAKVTIGTDDAVWVARSGGYIEKLLPLHTGELTPLWIAAENGHVGVVKLLLEKDADVNVRDNKGSTALKAAIEHGHTEIVQLLEQASAKKSDTSVSDKKEVEPNMISGIPR